MSLFPIHRPRVGISVRAHGLDLVKIRRRWGRQPLVQRVVSRPLPPGLLTPSAASLNIVDEAAFVAELRGLLAGIRERTLAVDVPMAAGTLGLFHFEAVPASVAEQEALLRWRLRQEEHVAANDLQVVFRLFRAQDGRGVSILAFAIRRSVLEQYHRVCEATGVLPASMGCSTLHLMEWYRRVMPDRSEQFFAHRMPEALAVCALRQGRPLFLRVRPWRATLDLRAELLTTLRYFETQHSIRPNADVDPSALYVFDESGAYDAAAGSTQQPSEVWTPSEHAPWKVDVTWAGWATVPIGSRVPEPMAPSLGALASVCAV